MSTNVGQVKNDVLHVMREYSVDGVVQADNDYLLSIVPLINFHQKVLARDTKCIEKRYEISHNKPENLLGTYEWSESEVHYDEDINYESQGAKAYSFQIADYATVYIEESADEETWTTLYTITKTMALLTVTDGVTPSTTTLDGSEGYVTVKGKTNLSDDDYYIRIRFSGDYRYPYRWVALFEDNFYDDDAVPAYEPFVPYLLPTDFFSLKRVSWTYANQIKEDYNAYRIEKHTKSRTTIFIKWYLEGEFAVEYFALPAMITVPTIPDLDAQDDVDIDIPDRVVPQLIELIASDLLSNENPYLSAGLKESAYIGINNINDQDDASEGFRKVINSNNW